MGESKRRQMASGNDCDRIRQYSIAGLTPDALGGDRRLQGIAAGILQAVLNSPELHRPVYRPDIGSEAQAEATPDLPLGYLWNEDPARGSCSVSVNGRIVGSLLEEHLPRTDPGFPAVQAYLTTTLAKGLERTVARMCERLQALPSSIF